MSCQGIAALFVVPLLASMQEVSTEALEARVQAIAEAALSSGVDGLSIAVAVGDETLYTAGFGVLGSRGRHAALADSPYPVGGLGESFIAALVMQLVDEGEIALTDPLSSVFEDLEWEGHEVTLHHLLSHSSGIGSLSDLARAAGVAPLMAEPQAVRALLVQAGLEFTPGRCLTYSDANLYLLGAIVEEKRGVPLQRMLTDVVFDGIDLEATSFDGDGGDPVQLEVPGDWTDHAPALFGFDKLMSSAPDLVRWMYAVNEGGLVSASGFARMSAANVLDDGTITGYGYGFSVVSLGDYEGLATGGGAGESRAHVARYADLDLTIAVLAHGENAPVDRIERDIARITFDLPSPEIVDRDLGPEERARYIGGYQIGCTRVTIRVEQGRLVFDSTDRGVLPLLYQGGHRFVTQDDFEVTLTFDVRDDDGPADSFTLDDRGVQAVATRWD